ncbi:MAG: hypothetical protein AAGJ10_02785 [Bacteroidota bacterium]
MPSDDLDPIDDGSQDDDGNGNGNSDGTGEGNGDGTGEGNGDGTGEGNRTPSEPMFDRYVALGADLTAGVMNGGLTPESQSQSYAALLAEAMGVAFNAPPIANPGCPPPYADPFTREPVSDAPCALQTITAADTLHNIALQGLRLPDYIRTTDDNRHALLGGLTPLEALEKANPTFVTLFFGTTDIARYLDSGDTSDLPWDDGKAYYSLLNTLDSLGVNDVLLIFPPLLNYINPYWPSVLEYIEARDDGRIPSTFQFSDSCADPWRGGYRVPYSYGFLELLPKAQAGEEVLIDCDTDRRLISPLDPSVGNGGGGLFETLDVYNLEYDSPRLVIGGAGRFWEDERCETPDFPNLPGSGEPTFGYCLSNDGFRPNALGHRIMAERLVQQINREYNTNFTLP